MLYHKFLLSLSLLIRLPHPILISYNFMPQVNHKYILYPTSCISLLTCCGRLSMIWFSWTAMLEHSSVHFKFKMASWYNGSLLLYLRSHFKFLWPDPQRAALNLFYPKHLLLTRSNSQKSFYFILTIRTKIQPGQ